MHARQEASLWELLAGMFDFLPRNNPFNVPFSSFRRSA